MVQQRECRAVELGGALHGDLGAVAAEAARANAVRDRRPSPALPLNRLLHPNALASSTARKTPVSTTMTKITAVPDVTLRVLHKSYKQQPDYRPRW
jgi:hypothetical protein